MEGHIQEDCVVVIVPRYGVTAASCCASEKTEDVKGLDMMRTQKLPIKVWDHTVRV